MTTASEFFDKNRSTLIKAGIALALVLVLFIVWLMWASWKQGINNQGNETQQKIVALEKKVETQLSTCLDNSRVGAQVAEKEFNAVKDVLTSVASARYVDKDGNATNASGALGGGQFISALQENYPQISQESWKHLMDIVIGCRKDVRDDQDRLQHDAADFRAWTQTGGVFSSKIRNNFPNKNLTAHDALNNKDLTGSEALAYLTRVIKTSEATKAIDTATMPDQDLFGSD